MYCENCGKEVNFEEKLCKECVKQLAKASFPDPDNRKYGLDKALTGVILGFVGYLLVAISFLLFVEKMSVVNEFSIAFWIAIIALPFSIVALVLALISIRTFIKRKAVCAKPIVTLILGIIGTVLSIQTLFGVFMMIIIHLHAM